MDQSSLIQLAFNVYNNKGAYALLLGSGISRNAHIPTGWEITLDMINQIAALHGEDCGANPEGWYQNKFGGTPGYSQLLDHLGKTPTERNGLLRPYFEPTAQEREEGKKRPTAAHKAIAKLVADGFVRVLLTTNFDKLLEQALQDEGIPPTVISSADAVEGATPIVHSKCTIIKLNGDYLDTRAKNTIDELETYDERLNNLLNEVFDDFGIIVCGWSADWDKGLRSAIQRIKGRRYTCYWCIRGEPTALAKDLINLRAATVLKINDANSFFSELEQKLSALGDLNRPHPLSPKLAVANLKTYITEEKFRIRLHDLVGDEVGRVCTGLNPTRYPATGQPVPNAQTMEERFRSYLLDLHTLLPLVVNGCFWSKPHHDELWIRSITRVANAAPNTGGYDVWINMRLIPASLLLYAGGIAAVAGNHYNLFRKLLIDVKVKGLNDSGMALDELFSSNLVKKDLAQAMFEQDRKHLPMCEIYFDLLRPYLLEILGADDEYDRLFDKFEYLLALVYTFEHPNERGPDETRRFVWSPPGRFSWKRDDGEHISRDIQQEISMGASWPLLKAGLFNSDLERAKQSLHWLNNMTPNWNF